MQRGLLILFGLLSTMLLVFDQIDQEFDVFGSKFSLDLGFVDALERKAYDLRINLSAREASHNTVIIIDIDEESLLAEGQWPWRRAKVADLVDKLFDDYEIETLGFDAVFAEPENSFSRDQIVRALESDTLTLEDMEAESGDAKFAKALEDRSIVMGIVFEPGAEDNDQPESIGQLPPPMFSDDDVENENLLQETGALTAARYTANLPMFQEAAGEAGFFSILLQDPDGIIRRVGLLNKYEGRLYASLSLKLVQAYFLDEPQPVFADKNYTTDDYNSFEAIEFLMLEEPLRLDENAGVFVPYAKPGEGFEYVSATEILRGTYQGDIKGAIAILGTSAAGLVDRRSTPVAPALSGVEVHANVVAGILDGEFRVRPAWAIAANVVGIIILGIVLSVLFPYLSAFWSASVFAISSAAAIWLNWYMWTDKNLILAIAPALFLISFLYVMTTVVGFFMESAARRVTQKMFGMYVPPEVVAEMHDTEDIFSQKPERKLMTVLFTDIRNFTTHSESMSPEDLAEWLNDFLTPMTTIIHKHKGAIDKYMGDAIMAFWGAPLDDDDHAEHAVDAAKEMIDYLDTLNAHYRRKGWPEIAIGIGLNTGDMSVGNMGSEFRMAYTVVGDAVNLGSRLEGLTKQYGVPIIVSEYTMNAVSNYEFERLDHVKVKGKTEGVTIFSIGEKQ
ncbi:adenylate/guanylate cyclase domain-containing protein [Arenicella sp. 4NH20-0111]|uniref:CHASE2 domain-containing protein n=1 Tax=Arenicella sp. 4NH20-0111 TaxID=3127648 RepID=UPI00310C7EFA